MEQLTHMGLSVNTIYVVLIIFSLSIYFVWGLLTQKIFPQGHWFLNYCAYPFSMTHILLCLIGGVIRFYNWDPTLSWCATFEAPYNYWDVLLILQSLGYFAIDMLVVSRDPNYYVHHVMCITGYIVVVFVYPVPLKITIIGMFFAELGGFLLSLRQLEGEMVFRIFLILYALSRAGMTIVYTSYCYCAGLFSGHIPDTPHLIFCACGMAVTLQNLVWLRKQFQKYYRDYGVNGLKLKNKKQ